MLQTGRTLNSELTDGPNGGSDSEGLHTSLEKVTNPHELWASWTELQQSRENHAEWDYLSGLAGYWCAR